MTSLFRASWAERLLLVEAALWLGLARAAVLTLPFRWLTRRLPQQRAIAAMMDDPAILAQRQQIAWALAVISRHTPWQSNCLAQALAGKIMLGRRKITSTLYLGVAKNAYDQLDAHAWLRSGNTIVTGNGQLDRFVVIATFSDIPAA